MAGGIAVAVVVILLVLFFFFPGVVPFIGTKSGTTGPPASSALTYSQAQPMADNAESHYQGGGWVDLFAVGIAAVSTATLPFNASMGTSSGCNVSLASGAPSSSNPSRRGSPSLSAG